MISERLLKGVLVAGLAASALNAFRAWQNAETNIDWLFWLIWPAMLVHQCEENIVTEWVLGPRYGFLRWVRTVGYDISPARALGLNVLIGWTLAFGSGLVGTQAAWFPLFVILVETVNAFWHLSVTALTRRWSPGTLSSVLLTTPLGFWLCYLVVERELVSPMLCYTLFVAACVSHHSFLNSLPRTLPD